MGNLEKIEIMNIISNHFIYSEDALSGTPYLEGHCEIDEIDKCKLKKYFDNLQEKKIKSEKELCREFLISKNYNPSFKGFRYIEDILLTYFDLENAKITWIYSQTAKKFKTTYASVERSLRYLGIDKKVISLLMFEFNKMR